jgi:hypothetical protein
MTPTITAESGRRLIPFGLERRTVQHPKGFRPIVTLPASDHLGHDFFAHDLLSAQF